ncbi:hypothetical protein HELRODRAFT_193922 [Helobdella robusta]|uniref:Selenoprotein T n=1 Tax=Helobdella robusta TaxID=6412 RepID=T1FVH3_HELRO|nr:hypothetical protein HELRODRAFT_193922 [Helobdella robusta]ESN93701.1 hypothetical protein HELRODRAFT_193922 [Helobdella robusta]
MADVSLISYTALVCLGLFVSDFLKSGDQSLQNNMSSEEATTKKEISYKKTFQQYAQAIHENHHDSLIIKGEEYPAPPHRLYPAKFLNISKLFFIVCIILSINPFLWFNLPTPNFYYTALQNKIYSCLMLFFFVGFIEGFIMSTGAFEIYFNDMPIWSKLESGRIPTLSELFGMIDSQLKLYRSNKEFRDDDPL